MSLSKRIRESIKNLPDSAKAEVLDFVKFLKQKQSGETQNDQQNWSQFSLRSAMRGIDGQEEPDYSTEDIVESI